MKQNTDKTLTVKQNNFVTLGPLSVFCLSQSLLFLSSLSLSKSLHLEHYMHNHIKSFQVSEHTSPFFFSAHWHTECTSSRASPDCSGLETYKRYLATLKEYLISMLWSVVSIQFTHSHVCGWPRSRGSWISFLESSDRLEGFKTGWRSPLSWSSRLSHLSPLPCLSSNWAMLMRNSAILKEKNYKSYQHAIRSNIGGNVIFPYVVCGKCLSPRQNENRI